jgi:hypothetical protein
MGLGLIENCAFFNNNYSLNREVKKVKKFFSVIALLSLITFSVSDVYAQESRGGHHSWAQNGGGNHWNQNGGGNHWN